MFILLCQIRADNSLHILHTQYEINGFGLRRLVRLIKWGELE
jgi:hypothetical protein